MFALEQGWLNPDWVFSITYCKCCSDFAYGYPDVTITATTV